MMLVISIILGIAPLFGIAWTFATGTVKTQDGLFMSLILLSLSGLFFLNALWELRDRGAFAFLKKEKVTQPVTPKAAAKVTTESKDSKLKESEG